MVVYTEPVGTPFCAARTCAAPRERLLALRVRPAHAVGAHRALLHGGVSRGWAVVRAGGRELKGVSLRA